MLVVRRVVRLLTMLACYTALTVWFTWPLAATSGDRLPCTNPSSCTYDTPYSAWAVSWVSRALATAPSTLAGANIYHPARNALFYGPAGFGAVPFAMPVFAATGNAATAINVAFLSCTALTATALHWVAWRWTASTLAGFVAAWTFLVNRWFLWGFVATAPHLAAIQYLPLIVFLAARPLAGWPAALGLLSLITLQCLTDPAYAAPAVLVPLGVLALSRIARPARRPEGWRLVAVLAAAVVLQVPVLAGWASVRANDPDFAEQTVWKLHPLLAAEFANVPPTDLSRLLWSGGGATTTPPTATAPPILGLIALGALVAVVRRRRGADGRDLAAAWRHGAFWTVLGIVISLSPIATMGAAGRVVLPQSLLVPTGLYEVIRRPDRLGVAAMIGLCLLAGIAFAEIARALAASRIGARQQGALTIATAALVAALAHRIPPSGSAPLPLHYPTRPVAPTSAELLRALRAGDGPLLELPAFDSTKDRPDPRRNAEAMYRSTLHWRPLVNGYSSYFPDGFLARMRSTLLLPERSALQAIACETGLQTIVVDVRADAPGRVAWMRARKAPPPGLRLVAAIPGVLVFDVTRAPADPDGIDCRARDA